MLIIIACILYCLYFDDKSSSTYSVKYIQQNSAILERRTMFMNQLNRFQVLVNFGPVANDH